MRNFVNRRALVGFGGLVLTLAPYVLERDKMNTLAWLIVVSGVMLVIWGIIKPERQLSPRDAANLLEDRKQYLPQLKENIINKTRQLTYNKEIASKMAFEDYLKGYVVELSKSKTKLSGVVDILKYYMTIGFNVGLSLGNNLYYEDLKQNDSVFNDLQAVYDLLLAQVKDKNLKKKLNTYWDIEDKSNSRMIIEQMVRNAKTPLTPSRKIQVNLVEKFYSRKIKPIPISDVMNRIDELLYGELDE